ncbi:MAG: glycoside hydrolase family 125 protein [Kluyvera sp.]
MNIENREFIQLCGDRVRDRMDNPAIAAMLERALANTLDTTLQPSDQGVFVITGDIPAMWLRDSACQMRPYLLFCQHHRELQQMISGVIKQQIFFITQDPYANAFNRQPNGAGHQTDLTDMQPQVWERKYEIDSLCYPLQLAWQFWKITGETDHFTPTFAHACTLILQLWETEQHHDARSHYHFQRPNPLAPTDTLSHEGKGSPVSYTGMTWSGFRPSDDACDWGYLVPANFFATVVLGYMEEIARDILHDNLLCHRATALRASILDGIEKYAVVHHPVYGEMYCYETDGAKNNLLMDDANIPSLLSLPMLGAMANDDPRYLNTRRFILSVDNPSFRAGRFAQGVGSPHTPPGYIWPIALAVQGLTARDPGEKLAMIQMMVATDADTGLMHESFDPDNPANFTRPWFSWANAMFCELVLDYCDIRLADLITNKE